MAEEGLSCDVALGRRAAPRARRRVRPGADLHARQQQDRARSSTYAIERGVGHIVVDSFDEIDRLRAARAAAARDAARHARASSPTTHSYIQTGQEDSKFGFAHRRRAARGRALRRGGLELRGLHAHIGSQVFELEPFETARRGARRAGRLAAAQPRRRARRSPTPREDEPPLDRGRTPRRCCAARPTGVTVLCEPGRSLVGNAGVTHLHGGHRQGDPGRAHLRGGGRRDVRQPAADALRRPLRGRDRRPLRRATTLCTVAGMHCESGDILVRDVTLDDPRPGDVLVIPATGAYGHAMANNYNAVPPPAGRSSARTATPASSCAARPTRT